MAHVLATLNSANGTERRDITTGNFSDPMMAFVRGETVWESMTAAGKSVTPDAAITGTIAVYACVRVLAESVGQLPLLVYRDIGDRRERLPDTNPLARLLHQMPHHAFTATEFYETLMGHCALWGNAYAWIDRDGAGRPVELWPLRPDRVVPVFLADGRIVIPGEAAPDAFTVAERAYVFTLPSGEARILPRTNVLHVRAFAPDGNVGLSPITVARTAIGVEQAAGEYAARFYTNSALPGGYLAVPGPIGEEGARRLAAGWEQAHRGLNAAHKIAVLTAGTAWQAVGMPQRDAQFIETRTFQIREIARAFRVPPHLIQDLDRATWGNIESEAINFTVHTLGPWLRRIEQAVNRDLGTGTRTLRDAGFIPEFLVDAFLRGEIESRFRAYATGVQWGFLTRNEVRRRENLPPIEGGDDVLVPLNMAEGGSAA